MKKGWLNILFVILPFLLSGQEIISGLSGNPVVQQHYNNLIDQPDYKSQFLEIKPLILPFYDDFSKISIYPDTNRWLDNEAFINDNFGYYPVNYGVATLDVLDATGQVYLEATPYTFLADRLTSKPIRLDALFNENGDSVRPFEPADSIRLSFYYQPQGRGDVPLLQDSLVLQFGLYNGDTIFSHFDSTMVYGFNYEEAMANFGGQYLPPGFNILPWEYCDSIQYVLLDTFFIYDSLLIPCDSVYIVDTEWTSVWNASGDTLDVFIEDNDVFFKYVSIPIEDTNWLKRDFQFRFKNYGSISGINSWQSNTDQWNIDVVYLNHSRTFDDNYVREVSFSEKPGSLIKDYTTMPYQHYAGDVTKYKKDSVAAYIHNNDSVPYQVHYNYFVLNQAGDTLVPFLIGDIVKDITPLSELNVFNYQPFVKAPIKYFYTSPSLDTADFYVSHVVKDMEVLENADTLVYHQKFRNYFSYDDGSSEAGYGLTPAGAMLAISYRSEVPDTLRGLQMFFNKTFNNNNYVPINLAVWNDNNGVPGNLMYQEENVRPDFPDGINKFYNFEFNEYVKIGVQNYFVGWVQLTNYNMNIGYDRNNNTRNKNFYNVGNGWTNSSFEGSIMIRPIVGKALSEPEEKYKSTSEELVISPNPPGPISYFNIHLPAGSSDPSMREDLKLSIYDICGRVVYQGPYQESYPVSGLNQGFYIVSLLNTALSQQYSTKLLITK